jgi:hypothetical protein
VTERFIELTYTIAEDGDECPVLVRVDAIQHIMSINTDGSGGCFITFRTASDDPANDGDITVKESYATVKALVMGDE